MAMDWKNKLTKTPYLVLFMVLISIGVGTASALITITLAGNVVVTGDLDVDGDITGDGFEYNSPQIRTITYSSFEFISDRENGKREADTGNGIQVWLESNGTSSILRSPAHTIPNSAKITEFECHVIDISAEYDVNCILLWCDKGFSSSCNTISTLGTTGAPEGLELTSGALSEFVSRHSAAYVIAFKPSSTSCDSDCRFVSARITYEVSGVN